MASDKDFLEFLVGQIQNAGEITYRNMFGEYVMYCNGKLFALVCDNKLFIKPTESGKNFIGEVVLAPPYEGAKNYYRIDDQIEDREWLSELVRISEKELPVPKKKKPKRKK